MDSTKGSLEVGKDADIALFDDEMNCYMSISHGEIVFDNLNQ